MNKTDNQLEPWLSRVKQKLDLPTPASPIPSDENWLRLEKELFATPVAVQPAYHLRVWLSVAAVILVLLVGGAFFLYRGSERNNPASKEVLVAQRTTPRDAVSKSEAGIEHFSRGKEKPELAEKKNEVDLKKKTSAGKEFSSEKYSFQSDAKAGQEDTTEPDKTKEIAEKQSAPEPLVPEGTETFPILYPDKNPRDPIAGHSDIADDISLDLKSRQSGRHIKFNMSNSGGISLNGENHHSSMFASDISLKSIQVKSFDEEYAESSFSHRLPLNIGVKIDYGLSDRFSLESGLVYTYLSSQVSPRGTDKTLTQRVHYIGVPIGVNYNIWENRHLDLYAGVGGRVDKCISAALDDRFLRMNPLQFSAGGHVGLNYKLSRHVGFYLEPGISYFFDDGSALKTTYKENPLKATLSMGFRLLY